MPIRVRCPNPKCAFAKVLGDQLAGHKVKCPACGTPFTVPAGSQRTSGVGDTDLGDLLGEAVKEMGQPPGPRKGAPAGAALCNQCGEVYNPAAGPCPVCYPDGLTVPKVRTRREKEQRRRMLGWAIRGGVAAAALVVILVVVHAAGAGGRRAMNDGRALYSKALAYEASGQFVAAVDAYKAALRTLGQAGERAEPLRKEVEQRLDQCRRQQVDSLLAAARGRLEADDFARAADMVREAREKAAEVGLTGREVQDQLDRLAGQVSERRIAAEKALAEKMEKEGYVRFEGNWMKKEERDKTVKARFEEAQRAKGLEPFDDDWLTPAQVTRRREEIRRFTVPVPASLQREWLMEWAREVSLLPAVRYERGDDTAAFYWCTDLRMTNTSPYPVRLEGDVLVWSQDQKGVWHAGVAQTAGAWREAAAYLPEAGPAGVVLIGPDLNGQWRAKELNASVWVPIKTQPGIGVKWERLYVILPRIEAKLSRRALALAVVGVMGWESGKWVLREAVWLPWNAVVLERTARDPAVDELVRRLACWLLTQAPGKTTRGILEGLAQDGSQPQGVRDAAGRALQALPAK